MAMRLVLLICIFFAACSAGIGAPSDSGTLIKGIAQAGDIDVAVDEGSLLCPDPLPADWSVGEVLRTITVTNTRSESTGDCAGYHDAIRVLLSITAGSPAFRLRFGSQDLLSEAFTLDPGDARAVPIVAIAPPAHGDTIEVKIEFTAMDCVKTEATDEGGEPTYTYSTKEGDTIAKEPSLLHFTYLCKDVASTTARDDITFQLRRFTRDAGGVIESWDDTAAHAPIDGSTIEDLGAANTGYMTDPTWSPGGDWIAYAGGPDLYDHNLWKKRVSSDGTLAQAGSDPIRLTDFVVDDIKVLEPAWNPADEGQIACVLHTFNHTTLSDEFWIVLIDADTGATIRELTTRAGGRAMSPAWSPDGTQIAFTTDFASLYVVPADGSAPPSLLLASEIAQPSWSPYGTRIVYSATGAGVTGTRLWTIDPSASPPVPVQVTTESGDWFDEMPAWTSDSNGIVFTRFFNDDRVARLYRTAADGDGTATELPFMAALTADEAATHPQPFIPRDQ